MTQRLLCTGNADAHRVTLHVAPGVMWQLSPAINAATLEEALEAINVALSYNDGWDVYRNWQPPGRCIRSNEAMAGWMAARDEHHEQQDCRNYPADAA